jgi:hypothetical protein
VCGFTRADLHLLTCAFEDAWLSSRGFDLVAAATSYHWLDPDIALADGRRAEAGRMPRCGGTSLPISIANPFHDATLPLLGDQAVSPSGAPDAIPFVLDRARESSSRGGAARLPAYFETRWTLVLILHEWAACTRLLTPAAAAIGARGVVAASDGHADTQFGGRVDAT